MTNENTPKVEPKVGHVYEVTTHSERLRWTLNEPYVRHSDQAPFWMATCESLVDNVYVNNVDARIILTSFDTENQVYRATERLRGRVTQLEVPAAAVVTRIKNATWRLAPEPVLTVGDVYLSTSAEQPVTLIEFTRFAPDSVPMCVIQYDDSSSPGARVRTCECVTKAFVSNLVKMGKWYPRAPETGARVIEAGVACGLGMSDDVTVIGPADQKLYKASDPRTLVGDPNVRCPRCRAVGTLPPVRDAFKLDGCTSCGEYVPLAERIAVSPPPVPTKVRAGSREEAEQILARDARQTPAFAEARRAAVLAALEGNGGKSGSGLENVTHFLILLHKHEAERGGGRLPDALRERRERFAYPVLFRTYERARSSKPQESQLKLDPALVKRVHQVQTDANRQRAIRQTFTVEQDIAKVFRPDLEPELRRQCEEIARRHAYGARLPLRSAG